MQADTEPPADPPLDTGAMVRLLPRLRASDAHLLNEAQRNCLHRALSHRNLLLQDAILRALEQVGDVRAIPYVETLLDSHRTIPEIRRLAEAVLLALQERAELERTGAHLLRPALADDSALLHPASATTADDDLLARPIVGTETPVAVKAGLAPLLARLRASDAGLLTDAAIDALILELEGQDAEWIVTILNALEQIGDERAKSNVRRLAVRMGAGWRPGVQAAAEACWEMLVDREERSQQEHVLLRPADGANDATSTLVRPAHATESATENLVRPADTGAQ